VVCFSPVEQILPLRANGLYICSPDGLFAKFRLTVLFQSKHFVLLYPIFSPIDTKCYNTGNSFKILTGWKHGH
jgi:hypothetical protein